MYTVDYKYKEEPNKAKNFSTAAEAEAFMKEKWGQGFDAVMSQSDGMVFTINCADKIVHHWFLENHQDVLDKIIATPEWKDENKFVAVVTVNGVEMPFESLERYLQTMYNATIADAKAQFADLEDEVQRRLEQRLKDEAQSIIDKMRELSYALDNVEDAIKPHWEK